MGSEPSADQHAQCGAYTISAQSPPEQQGEDELQVGLAEVSIHRHQLRQGQQGSCLKLLIQASHDGPVQ